MLETAARLLTPSEKAPPDEWARKNRVYHEGSGLPGPRDPDLTKYLVPFARKIHARRHRRVVAVTAAQSGKTENMLDTMGATLDQRPVPILYVGPSKDFVEDQFEPRVAELVSGAETLTGKVTPGWGNKKLLKTIAGVRVRLATAGSSSALKSDPFGAGYVDEYDEMTANIKGQGDPLGLAEARGDTYADFVTAVTSTPSIGVVGTEIDPVNGLTFWKREDPEQIESPIWRLFQQGTMHHFAWPCPHCGRFFIPRSENLHWPKGSTPAQARKSAYMLCGYDDCGAVIENSQKAEMIAGGIQIAPGQTIEDALDERNEPENEIWSCWTSGLCSPFVTFGDRAARYLTALESGEDDKVQTAVNAGFGELHSPAAGTDMPEWKEIEERQLPYRENEVPAEGVHLLMAVDVQKFSLFYVIRAFGARGTSWLVTSGQLYGPTDMDEVWQALEDLMITPIGGMQVEKVFVDSGFRPNKKDGVNEHKVYEFCRRWSWICYPTKGKDVQKRPFTVSRIEVKPDGKTARYSIELIWLSTDFFKSLVMSRIKTPIGVPGAFYVHSDISEDYCRQVASEARTVTDGKPVWVKRHRDNHFLDCEAMLAAAAYSINVQRIPEGVSRGEPEADEVHSSPASADGKQSATGGAPPPKPSRWQPKGGGGGARSRFAGLGSRMNR